tara:strand:- start:535 stop:1137 length:603 start_codon:yes stop_codon:yes gene_type:complete
MTDRKRKLLFTQLALLVVGLIIIFFTYFQDGENFLKKNSLNNQNDTIIQKLNEEDKKDVFLNIEYSGLDFSGNRYILKSKEAINDNSLNEIVHLKGVTSDFYFKDNTVLTVKSDKGRYNNKTLDMTFEGNVEASYEKSKLFAEQAEYINSQSFLIVSKNVKVEDPKGSINADKLFFDIKKQKLNISSLNNNKINANVNLK